MALAACPCARRCEAVGTGSSPGYPRLSLTCRVGLALLPSHHTISILSFPHKNPSETSTPSNEVITPGHNGKNAACF